MKIEQIYTGCLAQGAYYIESEGEVAIIDPLREVQPYIDRAQKDGARIRYILETHFHADFVSGHVTLAEKTGAGIVYGPTAKPAFNAYVAKDGDELPLGRVSIKVLHTPGHTMESTTYLLRDEEGRDHAIFTGDTLFLGDVGRPDLAQKAANMTREQLAATLYHSLRNKIMPLADDVIVYPAHGAGSACGKNMMKETVDTLGNQKAVNYALRADMTEEEFVKEVCDGLLPPPQYFPLNVQMNKEGYESIDTVLERGTRALSPSAFEAAANETGAVILDIRQQSDFVKGHIPNSIFIGLHGDFAPWVGALIQDVKHPILLVSPEGKEKEAITRLARVGFDQVLGYLEGGFESWTASGKETADLASIDAGQFKQDKENGISILDVRRAGEFEAEHIVDALNVPLDYLSNRLAEIPQNDTIYIHCAGGYRSVIAASILKSRGYHDLVNVEGGMKAIREVGMALTDFSCSKSTT